MPNPYKRTIIVGTNTGNGHAPTSTFSHIFWRTEAAQAAVEFLRSKGWDVIILDDTRGPQEDKD